MRGLTGGKLCFSTCAGQLVSRGSSPNPSIPIDPYCALGSLEPMGYGPNGNLRMSTDMQQMSSDTERFGLRASSLCQATRGTLNPGHSHLKQLCEASGISLIDVGGCTSLAFSPRAGSNPQPKPWLQRRRQRRNHHRHGDFARDFLAHGRPLWCDHW